jgi:hypothetical protein
MLIRTDSNPLFSIKLTCASEGIRRDWSPAGPHAIRFEPEAVSLLDRRIIAGPGDFVPVIRADHGQAVVSVAHWGRRQAIGVQEYFRPCSGQTLGYPCLIPTKEVLLTSGREPLSLRMRDRVRMYIGCMYFQPGRGAPIDVVPLFLPAGPDVSGSGDFQPLLIPVSALPRPGIWDFITPYGAPHLRKPLPEGSLVVGPINYQTSALVSA